MSALDLVAETDRLEAEFAQTLRTLGFGADRISADLVSRMRLRASADHRWTQQFSSLTLLYPLLQCEGLAGIEEDVARRATLAHLCLLTHAFTEDRHFDGQIGPTQLELLFSKSLLLEGWVMLHALPGVDDTFRRTAKDLLARYARSHAPDTRVGSRDTLSDDYILASASARAAYGALAPLALAYGAKPAFDIPQRVEAAFYALAAALQWADDIEDWPGDLDRNDRNFLLATLRLRGHDPYVVPCSVDRRRVVAEAILERGVLSHAIAEANRWIAEAADRQNALNCRQLSELIVENFRPLSDAAKRFEARILRVAAPTEATR